MQRRVFAAGVTGPLWGEWSEASGRHAVEVLRTKGVRYDAVFCGSDQVARGVVDALRSVGTRVPDDVAVVGYDNWDIMVEASRSRLTTVDPLLADLGRTAASYLLDLIERRSAPVGVSTMPCRLVLRESSEATVIEG